MKSIDKKVSDFLEELASRSPVPGGGSAAALVGALGASLLGMVAHFTRTKKVSGKLLFESSRIRNRLAHAVDEDIQSYLKVTRARGAARRKKSLKKALASSLTICKASCDGLRLSKKLLKLANPSLKSDVKAGAFFFFAAFHAGYFMSQTNAIWLRERRVSRRVEKMLLPLRKEVDKIIQEIRKR